MLSLAETLESAIFGAAISIFLTYLYSRRKGAEVLDGGLHQVLGEKEQSIGRMADVIRQRDLTINEQIASADSIKNKRSPVDQHHFDIAKSTVETMDSTYIDALRFLYGQRSWTHQYTQGSSNAFSPDPIPNGFTPATLATIYERSVSKSLVTRKNTTKPTGGVATLHETEYKIVPAMEKPLGELLFPPVAS